MSQDTKQGAGPLRLMTDARWSDAESGERVSVKGDLFYLASEYADLRAQNERLEKLVYVPGLWRCAKCEFSCVSTNLHAKSGNFSANNSPQQCSNGCGPMWRVTERDAGNQMVDRYDALKTKSDSLVAALDDLHIDGVVQAMCCHDISKVHVPLYVWNKLRAALKAAKAHP